MVYFSIGFSAESARIIQMGFIFFCSTGSEKGWINSVVKKVKRKINTKRVNRKKLCIFHLYYFSAILNLPRDKRTAKIYITKSSWTINVDFKISFFFLVFILSTLIGFSCFLWAFFIINIVGKTRNNYCKFKEVLFYWSL